MFSMKSLLNSWDCFFFQEKPTEGIALFRIVWMSIALIYFFMDLGNIQDFYGPHAILSHNSVRGQFPFLHLNIFNLFRPGYEATYGIITVYGLAVICSIMGLFTRHSLIIAFICMTSLHQRNIWLLSSSELLLRTVTLFLIFSPCGHSLSVDSMLGKYFPQFKRKKTWPVWALRLIQIQISVVYLWTVWHKLKGETWINGEAVYYATRLENMTNFSVPWIMDSLVALKLMSWGTLIVEFSLGFFIWFKKLRKPVIYIGIIFHLSIQYTMSIPFFELFMMALLLNFFTPEEHKRFVYRVISKIRFYFQDIPRGQHETAN